MRQAIPRSVIKSLLDKNPSVPTCQVRRHEQSGVFRRASLGQTVREMLIDASAAKTLYVPGIDSAALLLDRAINKPSRKAI